MKAEGDFREYRVPCRGCGMTHHTVAEREGTRLFRCPRCGRTTEVWIVYERGEMVLRSSLRKSPGGERG